MVSDSKENAPDTTPTIREEVETDVQPISDAAPAIIQENNGISDSTTVVDPSPNQVIIEESAAAEEVRLILKHYRNIDCLRKYSPTISAPCWRRTLFANRSSWGRHFSVNIGGTGSRMRRRRDGFVAISWPRRGYKDTGRSSTHGNDIIFHSLGRGGRTNPVTWNWAW